MKRRESGSSKWSRPMGRVRTKRWSGLRLVRFGVRGGPRAAKRARRSVPPTAGQWTCNCDLNRRNNGSIASSEKRLSKVFKGALKTIAYRNQAAGSGRRLWVTAKDAARGAPLRAVIHDPFVPISLKPKNQSAGEACSSSFSHLMTVGRLTPSARAISL